MLVEVLIKFELKGKKLSRSTMMKDLETYLQLKAEEYLSCNNTEIKIVNHVVKTPVGWRHIFKGSKV